MYESRQRLSDTAHVVEPWEIVPVPSGMLILIFLMSWYVWSAPAAVRTSSVNPAVWPGARMRVLSVRETTGMASPSGFATIAKL